jgi:hypothetical protein
MEAIVDPFILLSKNRITRHRFAMTANVMDNASPTLRIVGFDLYSMTCVPAVLTYHYGFDCRMSLCMCLDQISRTCSYIIS